MSGLAAGLARGLAMYGQGRMIAEDREYERQQKEAERKRQEARDAVLMEQTRLSMENTRQEMERRKAQDGIEAETRMNAARADGYRPVQDATRLATSLEAADALVPGLGVHGRAMQQQAATADRTVNGTAMARIGESDTERQTRMARQEQQGLLMQQAAEQNRMLETIRAQLPKAVRPLAVDLKTAQSLLGKYAEQRMAPPKAGPAPVPMQLVDTNEGLMQWNPRTGEFRPAVIPGNAPNVAPSGAQRPTSVPENPLAQVPGSGFSSQFQPPRPAAPANTAPPAEASGERRLTRVSKGSVPENFQKQMLSLETSDALLSQYEQALEKIGDTAWMAGDNQALIEAEAAHRQLLFAAKNAFELGVLNGNDQLLIEQAIGAPTGPMAKVRGVQGIRKQIAVAKASNAQKRRVLGQVYKQTPATDAAPSSARTIPPSIWNED